MRFWNASGLRSRCDLFNKAYNHISDRIDQVYKDLTKGKASPMGGVAYLSLEDSEVCISVRKLYLPLANHISGTLCRRHQIPCYATDEAFPRHGAIIWRGENGCRTCSLVRHPQVKLLSAISSTRLTLVRDLQLSTCTVLRP